MQESFETTFTGSVGDTSKVVPRKARREVTFLPVRLAPIKTNYGTNMNSASKPTTFSKVPIMLDDDDDIPDRTCTTEVEGNLPGKYIPFWHFTSCPHKVSMTMYMRFSTPSGTEVLILLCFCSC